MNDFSGIHCYSYSEDSLINCIKFCGANNIPSIRYALMSAPLSYDYTPQTDFWSLSGNGCWHDVASAPDYLSKHSIIIDRINRHVARLKRLKPLCITNNVNIVVDFHLWYGSAYQPDTNNNHSIFYSNEMQDLFVKAWKALAYGLKDQSHIIGYDLMNEPSYRSSPVYKELIKQLCNVIRSIDNQTPIIVEGRVDDINNLTRINPDQWNFTHSMIWSGHWWFKVNFTVSGNGIYPNPVTNFNKTTQKERFKKVVDWKNKYGVSLYCGEMGVDLRPTLTYDEWIKQGVGLWVKDNLDIIRRNAAVVYHDWNGALESKYTDDIEVTKKRAYLKQLVVKFCKR